MWRHSIRLIALGLQETGGVARHHIDFQVETGARFDRVEGAKPDETDLDLHLEGGHSARRVAHAADMTGREVERALLEAVARSPRVRMLEGHGARWAFGN